MSSCIQFIIVKLHARGSSGKVWKFVNVDLKCVTAEAATAAMVSPPQASMSINLSHTSITSTSNQFACIHFVSCNTRPTIASIWYRSTRTLYDNYTPLFILCQNVDGLGRLNWVIDHFLLLPLVWKQWATGLVCTLQYWWWLLLP